MQADDNQDALAQQAALENPVVAMKALRITTETGDSVLRERFTKAYALVNGSAPDLPVTQNNITAAMRDWKINQAIPSWLARACVLADRQSA